MGCRLVRQQDAGPADDRARDRGIRVTEASVRETRREEKSRRREHENRGRGSRQEIGPRGRLDTTREGPCGGNRRERETGSVKLRPGGPESRRFLDLRGLIPPEEQR